jgi:hypothetical protein
MCWAPVWLSAYPGFFAYDATDELSEVLGDRVGTHHPPLHVLLLGYGVKYLYGLTGEWNRAIAVWIGAQALLVAAVFAWILGKLARLEAPLWAVAAGLAYYALFPTVVMFALCSTKDVLFSAAVTALMVLLVDLAKGRWDARFAWLLAGVALAALSLRVNMVYAYIPFALLAVWRMRGQRRRAAVVLGAPALVALFATQVLYPLVLHYVPAPIQDKLGVPIQQLARVYNLADDVSAADRERIERWWADQRHLLRYYPPNADPPKYGVNSPAIEADQSEFWRDWLAVGLNHPAVYVNATLAGTYEGWYPGAVITGYNFPGSPTPIHGPGITDYFVFYTEKPGLMHEPSALPAVRNLYEALSRSPATSRVPVLSWLMSPASMVMLLVFACGLVARRGARGAAMRLPLAMFALIVLTVYLGPVMLVRYFLYLFFAFPLLVALLARPSTFDLRPDVRLPNGKRVSAW